MVKVLNLLVTTTFTLLNAYTFIYIVLGIFKTRRFVKSQKQYHYAFIIPARNEEGVLGRLIESIHQQKYPQELITIFVVADNCDDQTAKVARDLGAIVYERFDKLHQTKGYAMQFLFKQIARDFPDGAFDGYFVFDADNILKSDYIQHMNDAFASGEKIITSFRNSKNIDTNLLSAMNSMHFLRTNRFAHRPRSYLHLSTIIQGTGFLFAHEMIKDGWNYVDLTEDRSFSVDALLKGYRITYCDDAEFYDEQPTTFKMIIRQRKRWAKGHLMITSRVFKPLVQSMFKQRSFASYDMLIINIPLVLIMFLWGLLIFILNVINLLVGDGGFWLPFLQLLKTIFVSGLITWMILSLQAIYIFIVERKRLKKLSFFRKVLIILTWPLFDILDVPTKIMALFSSGKWKPIPHNDKSGLKEIEKATEQN